MIQSFQLNNRFLTLISKFKPYFLYTKYEILSNISINVKKSIDNVACVFGTTCCHASLQCNGYFSNKKTGIDFLPFGQYPGCHALGEMFLKAKKKVNHHHQRFS